MLKIQSITLRSDRKRQFLLNLAKDLRSIGFKSRIVTQNDKIRFMAQRSRLNQRQVLQLMKSIRHKQLLKSKGFIERIESNSIIECFINGNDLKIENISPRIHICNSSRDFEIYNYCQFLQSVPSKNRIGRHIRALVYDDGQSNPVLMGAIGLASSMYTVGCRDKYLNWVGKKAKYLKDIGLKRMMDLYLCIAFPPYSLLLGGKLMAMFAMTDPIKIEFQRKYNMPLLGLITTCATGVHCPIFNRIMVREGGLYRHIENTAGYTTVFFSDDTMRTARTLVGDTENSDSNGLPVSSLSLRILRQAMKLCDIPYEPLLRLGNTKGVYLAILSKDNLVSLKTGYQLETNDGFSITNAFEYWKTNIMPKRIYSETTINKIMRYRCKRLPMSSLLE